MKRGRKEVQEEGPGLEAQEKAHMYESKWEKVKSTIGDRVRFRGVEVWNKKHLNLPLEGFKPESHIGGLVTDRVSNLWGWFLEIQS